VPALNLPAAAYELRRDSEVPNVYLEPLPYGYGSCRSTAGLFRYIWKIPTLEKSLLAPFRAFRRTVTGIPLRVRKRH
jgi:hypothetical protein